MKKYTIRIDSEMSLNAKVVDYLPKFNGEDTFDTEIEAYKFALMMSRSLYRVNPDITIRIKEVEAE